MGISMDDVLEGMKKYIGELEADNRDMLETIESLQETVEKLSHKNEELRMRLMVEPEPMFPPFSMQMELDEMIKRQWSSDNFGFRGGKRP